MRPIFWRRCDGTRPCLATGGRRRGAGLRSALRISAIALIAACATPASAQTVTLRPGSDGVTVEYDLGREADLLIFEDQDTVRADWSTPTPDVVISQDGLRSARPLEAIRVDLRPDGTEEGRGYIALTRLGEGYVLHAPALRIVGESLSLEVDLPDGWTLLPGPTFDGYLYLGPASAVSRGRSGGIRIGSAAPSAAERALFEGFDPALEFFARAFGPLPHAPVMAITSQGTGPIPFRGDVTDGGVISIRFHGDLGEPDADARLQIQHFAFHETSHLWNSHLAKPLDGPRWLHEGGAEYLALVAAVSTGHLTEAQARASLSQSLTDCSTALADRPDARARISGGPAVYSCGAVIQWLADLELRQDFGQPQGVVSIWSGWIERARHGQVHYGPDDLTSALAPTSAVVALLDGPPESRWRDLEAALARLNVRWVNRPSDSSLLAASLRHLKRQACGGGLSYFVRAGAVEMENGDDCGPFAGTVVLATVEGHDPVTGAAAMFDAVQSKCARREPVGVVLQGNATGFSIPCGADLATPAAYLVTDAPPIGLPTVVGP
ncbi:MAG: hypothetical protein K2X07_08405 [Caulobacteraceae bacterium]|nr:hypothetical protein [Caulobacteraceae bacterium]